MYVPAHFAVSDLSEVEAFVARAGAADLVTFDGTGLAATLLPVIWDQAGGRGPDGRQGPSSGHGSGSEHGSGGEHGRLLGHVALANPQWRTAQPGVPGLAIVHGPQAYVSPSWYPSTGEHGRTVPTWNYTTVHFTGPVTFHQEAGWLRDIVTRLTDRHERHRDHPWRVQDAPPAYVEGQLRGIVGVEMTITRVEAKDKLSQNRGPADRAGALAGLRGTSEPGAQAIADLMQARDPAPG